MSVSDKIGIVIAAIGGFIDAFEVFFPGRIARMTHTARTLVFVVGTMLLAVGLGVLFFWPEGPKPQPDPPITNNYYLPPPPPVIAPAKPLPTNPTKRHHLHIPAQPAAGDCSGNTVTGHDNAQSNDCSH